MRRRRHHKAERAPAPAPPPAPARGAPLALLVQELQRAQHRAALASHLADRVYSDYLGEDGPPRFLITVGSGPPIQADSDSVIELAGILAAAADTARERVIEILKLELPGGGTPGDEVEVPALDQFEARVVTSHTPRGSPAGRR